MLLELYEIRKMGDFTKKAVPYYRIKNNFVIWKTFCSKEL